MADGRCPVCAAATDTEHRYCAACGVRLDTPVVFDGDRADVQIVDSGSRGRLAAVLVPLGVAAALALGGLALFGGGDDEEPDQPAASANPTPSVAVPTPTDPAATPAPGQPARPSPRPTSTPTPAPPPSVLDLPPADLSALPDTDATHVLVTHGRDLLYLELATGTWTLHERVGQVNGPFRQFVIPVARGAVLNTDGGALYAPVDGPPLLVAGGRAIGAADGLVYVQDQSQPSTPVQVVDTTGAVVETVELPDRTWAQWVTPAGEIVLFAAGQVYLRSPDEVTSIAQGEALGLADGHILVHECDGDLECRYRLLDLIDRSAVVLDGLSDTGFFPELIDRQTIIVYGPDGSTRYTIEDDGLSRPDDGLDPLDVRDLYHPTATDGSGLHAVIEGDRLVFHGPTGEPFTQVELDLLGGFGEYNVAFITVEDDG